LDVAIHFTADGIAEVEETITLPSAPVSTFVRRVIPERADRVEFLGASIDGGSAPPSGVSVESAGIDGFLVTWRLEDTAAAERALGLRYRATGVLAIEGQRGALVWHALPPRRDYAIGAVRIVVTVPPGTLRVGSWGIAEPAWQVVELSNGIAAGRGQLAPADQGTVLAQVAVEPATLSEPQWQHEAALSRQLIPAFISGGLFILVIGAGVLWIIRLEAVTRTGRRSGWRQAVPAQTAEGLYTAGLVCAAFGVIVLGVVYFTLRRYGDWSLAIPASILAVGAMFLLAGKRGPAAP
jgi:hypothetical protein